jgi:hypothetical protein
MSLTFIFDHVVKALDRLPEQYRGKPRLSTFIAIFVQEIQTLETMFQTLHTLRSIDTAEGVQLDGVGQIAGLKRVPGQSDQLYRQLIKTRIAQNFNQGTPEEMIAAAKFFLGTDDINYNELYPAAMAIMSSVELNGSQAAFIYGQLRRLKAGGVALAEFGHYPTERAFRFDLPDDNSFGDVNDGTVGGVFSDLYF